MISLATSTWGREEKQAAAEVIESGQITMGRRVQEFEEAYARYCGTRYCVAVNSGSSANLLMVAAYTLRFGPGTVIVPAVGWATSYSPFQQYGWKLIFVDIDPATLNYNLSKLWGAVEKYQNEDPVVLAINLLGNPNDFNAFPRKCHVLEDNCEAMGAEYDRRKTGSFGLMSSHSTYFSHHICTGEGGMVTTDDEHFYHMLLSLRSHGWTRHLPSDNKLRAKVEHFGFILPGYNVRPTEIQAAIGLEQLKKLDGFVRLRRQNASAFPCRTQKEIGKSSWYGFAIHESDWDRFSGYDSRPVVTGNFLRQPVMRYFDYEVFGDLASADYVHDHMRMIGNSGTEAMPFALEFAES